MSARHMPAHKHMQNMTNTQQTNQHTHPCVCLCTQIGLNFSIKDDQNVGTSEVFIWSQRKVTMGESGTN